MPKKIMILAGEPSGDMHGANLARELKALAPDIDICGIGTEKMRQEGVRLFRDMKDLSVVGIFDVLKKLGPILSLMKLLVKKLQDEKPDAVVLIDYPGFNLKFAEEAKKRNITVIYYISPQIWAWHPERINKIKRCVDKMIVVFDFEEKLYKENNVDVSFVGHPLLDMAKPAMDKKSALRKFGLEDKLFTVGILPGSRKSELNYNLPAMIGAATIIKDKFHEDVGFVLLKSPSLPADEYEKITKHSHLDIPLVENSNYDVINVCDALMVCSGTATLETAVIGKPMVIIYKVSKLSWFLFRPLVKVPNIGLANIVAGKTVVPELLQNDASALKIAEEITSMLIDKQRSQEIKEEFEIVKKKLGTPGASQRAAKIIFDFISKR